MNLYELKKEYPVGTILTDEFGNYIKVKNYVIDKTYSQCITVIWDMDDNLTWKYLVSTFIENLQKKTWRKKK